MKFGVRKNVAYPQQYDCLSPFKRVYFPMLINCMNPINGCLGGGGVFSVQIALFAHVPYKGR